MDAVEEALAGRLTQWAEEGLSQDAWEAEVEERVEQAKADRVEEILDEIHAIEYEGE